MKVLENSPNLVQYLNSFEISANSLDDLLRSIRKIVNEGVKGLYLNDLIKEFQVIKEEVINKVRKKDPDLASFIENINPEYATYAKLSIDEELALKFWALKAVYYIWMDPMWIGSQIDHIEEYIRNGKDDKLKRNLNTILEFYKKIEPLILIHNFFDSYLTIVEGKRGWPVNNHLRGMKCIVLEMRRLLPSVAKELESIYNQLRGSVYTIDLKLAFKYLFSSLKLANFSKLWIT